MQLPSRFTSKHVLVTGGGSGIGRAIALRFAAEGAHVIILELRAEAGAEVVAAIVAAGGSAEVVAADVASTDSMRRAFESIGALDVLVNNAGIAHVGNVLNTSAEDLDRLYAVNVRGAYHTLHFGIPKLLERGGGAILNLASIASKVGLQDRFAYGMTKGAMLSMTLSVARDFVDKKIRCNCVCPARVHTPFVDGFISKNYPGREAEMFQKLSASQPIGRMGEPHEVAALAAFLCSAEAGFITGSAYDIDGGVTLLR
ncbi:MAG: SDR family oxidoreductase [Opitutaceae bacterium]|jgi:NAD(P)-dependent dehydrogenase (short-subunit alcohol dehydrogenase family)|nr:SDR family oxidoreductase [Opitutaceae bacterium]